MRRFDFAQRKAVIAIVMALASLLCFHSAKADAQTDAPAAFVGAKACSGCHATEAERWKSSHHALAMQKATAATVLGNFAYAPLTHHGITTIFSRNGEKFMVRTEGPDGGPHDYEIAYTFGVYPLQQYLIAFPGGRYQALGIAWDSRPKEQGGQRWFPLYPSQILRAGDSLHWTGRDQSWNYQCASCHSTDLKKNYDLAADSYATSWTDINVACEACHGPGSRHTAWAKARKAESPGPSQAEPNRPPETGRMGLTTRLEPANHDQWRMNPDTGIAQRTEPLNTQELDVCAECHSRSIALKLHLYHYVFRDLVRWAIANGYKWIQNGALNYDPKLHFRHRLDPIDLYVRHTSVIINAIMRLALILLEPTRHDPTLKKFPNYLELWDQ